jgi:hypothetical protein
MKRFTRIIVTVARPPAAGYEDFPMCLISL